MPPASKNDYNAASFFTQLSQDLTQFRDPAADPEQEAKLSYLDWLRETLPRTWTVDADHIRLISEHLDAVERGEIDRLAIHMPPRHGKSETVTYRFPVRWLELHPRDNVLVTGYNERFARKFGRRCRNLAMERGIASATKSAADEWETTSGGLLMTRGVGSPPTGTGFNGILIDDPVRRREDAESETFREKTWDWYTDDLYQRLEPGGWIVLIMTLWHEDDIGARAVASEPGRWTRLVLPALAEADDPLKRKPGRALWPARYNEEALQRIRSVMQQNEGERSFQALYQQAPRPREGTLFQESWFKSFAIEGDYYILKAAGRKEYVRRSDCWIFQTTDWAASEKTLADWTVVSTWAVTPRRDLLLLDVRRARKEGPEAKVMVSQAFHAFNPRPQFVGLEKNGLGLPLTQDLIREGIPVKAVAQTRDKVARATGSAARYQSGGIYHLEGAAWRADWESEHLGFPGKYDDQVDTGSLAVSLLAIEAVIFPEFGHGMHVADGPLDVDPTLPLLCGWANDPCLAFVVTQVDARGQWRLLTCSTADGGTAALEWAEGLLEAMQRRFAEPYGRQLSDLDIRHYGNPEWWETRTGKAAEGKELVRILRRGRRGAATEDGDHDGQPGLGLTLRRGEVTLRGRQEAVRGRLQKLIPGGIPGLLVDPRASSLVEMFSGGYQFKQLANGTYANEPDSNRYSALADALGHVASRLFTVRPVQDDDEDAAPVRSLSRGAGRRRE